MNISNIFFSCIVLITLSSSASAKLFNRGGGLIYDSALNVTWLADANYATTDLNDLTVNAIISTQSTIDGHILSINDFLKNTASGIYTGQMSWWGAKAWANHLVYTHPLLGVTYNQWRLPKIPLNSINCTNYNNSSRIDTYGYNCNDSELGRLYYVEFGAIPSLKASGIAASISPELENFSNIHEGFYHLDNTASPCLNLPDEDCSVYFSFYSGFQWGTLKTNLNYSWVVLDGDIATFDFDGDTVTDLIDNCPTVFNTNQLDSNNDGRGDACPTICLADFDIDGDVDTSDAAIFVADFGRSDCATGALCEGDFDFDNDVDTADAAVFSKDFGRVNCPIN